MADKRQALPPALLYSLLRALDPKKIAAGRSKAETGQKVDKTAKLAFQAAVQAADRAKSAKQFAKLIDDSGTDGVQTHGPITTLTVETQSTGYTIVTVRYEDGTGYIVVFPTT